MERLWKTVAEGIASPLYEVSEWIPVSEKTQAGMKCKRCKMKIRLSEANSGNFNYCPKCGAMMIKNVQQG